MAKRLKKYTVIGYWEDTQPFVDWVVAESADAAVDLSAGDSGSQKWVVCVLRGHLPDALTLDNVTRADQVNNPPEA